MAGTHRILKLLALAAVVSLAAAACSSGGGPSTTPTSSSKGPTPQRGGTLNIATNEDVFSHWDPQMEYFQESFAFYDCCLLATLMGYNGKDAANGGARVYPYAAASDPTVSSDGLTWTFHIRQGMYYSPPLQNVEITAQDFVRAMLREGDPNVAAGYPFYYDVIQGFSQYAAGKAKTISGLSTPDKFTLVVKLTQPAGDLPFRFAMPATAPIPPNPSDPSAPLGVAQGHDSNYGSYMVSSGPYMWQGSGSLNFKLPPSKQPTLPGLSPGKSWTFVRNPSWKPDAALQALHPSYVNEIQVTVSPSADPTVLDKSVTSGQYDTVFQNGIPPAILQQYLTTPSLKPYLHINPAPGNYYITMNMGTPPFNDIYVRKAVQYAIDKAAIQRIEGGPLVWPIAGHFVPNSLETLANGTQILKNYNPYATPQNRGDDTAAGLALAKKEMAQSQYGDSSGMCVAAACKNVLALGGNAGQQPAFNAQVKANLAKIGITLDLKQLNGSAVYTKILDPANRIPLALSPGWLEDYPDAYTFFWLIAYGPNILAQGNSNYSMIGATAAQLHKYGYKVTSVPSMDAQIKQCLPLTGDPRVQCWANADKYLMQNIAAIVPLTFNNTANIVSSRTCNYTYSLYDSQTSYDRIAVVCKKS